MRIIILNINGSISCWKKKNKKMIKKKNNEFPNELNFKMYLNNCIFISIE